VYCYSYEGTDLYCSKLNHIVTTVKIGTTKVKNPNTPFPRSVQSTMSLLSSYSIMSSFADQLVNCICLVGLIMAVSIVMLWGTSFIILMGWTRSMNAPGKKDLVDAVNNNQNTSKVIKNTKSS